MKLSLQAMLVSESQTFFSGKFITKLLLNAILILNRYVKNAYENVSSTIGVEFAYKVALLKNNVKVKV